MKNHKNTYDIVIIGAGPTGLCFASSLAQQGFNVAIVEKEAESVLRNPAPDGRETAHTHASITTLKKLGVLKRIPVAQVAPIREAKVMDGSSSTYFLNFSPDGVKQDALGFIISNYLVRKAAYEVAKTHKNITLLAGADVHALVTDDTCATVTLGNGKVLQAPLLVAADGRFSQSRRRMGIPTTTRDFGRSIIVCRFKHAKPHDGVAYECFNYERTLAMLPLPGKMASAVITLPSQDVDAVKAMNPKAFAEDVAARFQHRFGNMTLDGKSHVYPLVAVYAQRFIGNRFALIGDAAVGMHPVTAHGFNFGLKGQSILCENITKARDLGLDLGAPSVLDDYNRRHRAATLPLYLMTNSFVQLYTNEAPYGKILRRVGLHLGNIVTPVKKIVTDYLADAA